MKIQTTGQQMASFSRQETPLTDLQKEALQEILSRYEPENFSSQDRTALRQEIKDAGIPRTPETEKIIRDKGLYNQTTTESSQLSAYSGQQQEQLITPKIISLFKQHDLGELSDQQFQTQLEEMRQQFPKSSGNLINKPV